MINMIKALVRNMLPHLPVPVVCAIFTAKNYNFSYTKCHGNLIWFLTERCNLRCPHCFVFNKGRQLRPELEGNDIIRILETSREAIKSIVLTGGEPLLFKDFERVFEYTTTLKSLRFLIVSTNGMLYDKMLSLLDRTENKKIHYVIQTSLDGLRISITA